MLEITIKEELWDKETQQFVYPEPIELQLEHSLVSVSKWEQTVKKPFMQSEKSDEESNFYLLCMDLKGNLSPGVIRKLTKQQMETIADYIQDSMTATWFAEEVSPALSTQMVTAELIYSWMVAYQVDFEVQYWHFNRLLTLMKVLDQQKSTKKQNPQDVARWQSELNRKRRAQYGTTG